MSSNIFSLDCGQPFPFVANSNTTTTAAAALSDEDYMASFFRLPELEDEHVDPLDNTAAALNLALPTVFATTEGSSSSNEAEAEKVVGEIPSGGFDRMEEWTAKEAARVAAAQAEAADAEVAATLALPAKRGRGRPPGKKPKAAPVFYKCRYGCDKTMKGGHSLRKHMMRVHGIFSNVTEGPVLVHHCGRRYIASWKGLCCNNKSTVCKDLVEGSEDWKRHNVPWPSAPQDAAGCFAYDNGLKPVASGGRPSCCGGGGGCGG